MISTAGAAAKELFKQIKDDGGEISNEVLLGLHFLFKKVAHDAFAILEESRVSRLVAPSGRSFYKIESKSESYFCYPHFCTCPAFMFTVIMKQEATMCKHQLAICLGEALDCISERSITEEEYLDAVTS